MHLPLAGAAHRGQPCRHSLQTRELKKERVVQSFKLGGSLAIVVAAVPAVVLAVALSLAQRELHGGAEPEIRVSHAPGAWVAADDVIAGLEPQRGKLLALFGRHLAHEN